MSGTAYAPALDFLRLGIGGGLKPTWLGLDFLRLGIGGGLKPPIQA